MLILCESQSRVSAPYLQSEAVSFEAMTALSLPRLCGQITRAGEDCGWTNTNAIPVDNNPTPHDRKVDRIIGGNAAQERQHDQEERNGSEQPREEVVADNCHDQHGTTQEYETANRVWFGSKPQARGREGLVYGNHSHGIFPRLKRRVVDQFAVFWTAGQYPIQ